MIRVEIKERAKNQLGRNIFGSTWMLALLVLFLGGAILSAVSFTYVGTIILVGPIYYGFAFCFLKQARDGQPMNVGDLFKGFSDKFGDCLLIGLLTSIYTFLWSLLFVIPGIVKAYSYRMAYYIKLDHPEYSATQCITESRMMMQGHKGDLFVLDLSFIGWYILGGMCFGIGILWVVPYHQAAVAQFYDSINVAVPFESTENIG